MSTQQEDPYSGHGGRYVLDEKTGVRHLVERTQEQAPGDQPATSNEPLQEG